MKQEADTQRERSDGRHLGGHIPQHTETVVGACVFIMEHSWISHLHNAFVLMPETLEFVCNFFFFFGPECLMESKHSINVITD